jgi:hypothetical protein
MSFHRFQQGDSVKYVGEKLAKELNGKVGYICGRVGKTETGVVVDFGDGAYIMDEVQHLARFVGKPKSDLPSEKDETKRPEVQKRRGVKRKAEDETA